MNNYANVPFLHMPLVGPFLAVILAVVLLSLILKGFALWHSARNYQKIWFIVLLIVNTAGILEAIYLIFFRKDHNADAHHTTPPAPSSAPMA